MNFITKLLLLCLPIAIISASKSPSAKELEILRKEALKYHNLYRAKHQKTGKLKLNSLLNKFAQSHCDYLAYKGSLIHTTPNERMNIPYLKGYIGENLYLSTIRSFKNSGKAATETWYNEIKGYDFGKGGAKGDQTIEHFTQLVWDESRQVGFGFSSSPLGTFVCANYYKGVNVNGPANYKKHVKPLK